MVVRWDALSGHSAKVNVMSNAALVASLSPEVLALLAASYARPVEQVVERATRKPKADKPSKLRAVKAAALDAAKDRPAVPVAFLPIDLPKVGTIDAPTFIARLRALGPVFVGDQSRVDDVQRVQDATGNGFTFVQRRDAAMALIAGYCGFDRRVPFGVQLDNAREQAMRAIRGPVSPVKHTVSATLRGYVSGVCDERAKRLMDLQARERVAAEEMCEHETIARDENASPADRTLHAQLVLVEQARIEQIRADLRDMGE